MWKDNITQKTHTERDGIICQTVCLSSQCSRRVDFLLWSKFFQCCGDFSEAWGYDGCWLRLTLVNQNLVSVFVTFTLDFSFKWLVLTFSFLTTVRGAAVPSRKGGTTLGECTFRVLGESTWRLTCYKKISWLWASRNNVVSHACVHIFVDFLNSDNFKVAVWQNLETLSKYRHVKIAFQPKNVWLWVSFSFTW